MDKTLRSWDASSIRNVKAPYKVRRERILNIFTDAWWFEVLEELERKANNDQCVQEIIKLHEPRIPDCVKALFLLGH
uniref:Uncharacterized protein n=1 Tax=Ditylenchus dipsaci TaxID=166011 RepID=A0A915CTE6_9BILA